MAWVEGATYLTFTTLIANLCKGDELALIGGQAGEVCFTTGGAPVKLRIFISEIAQNAGASPRRRSQFRGRY
jgi:hypothetical protein